MNILLSGLIWSLVSIIGIFVALYDLKTHKILNKYIIALFALGTIHACIPIDGELHIKESVLGFGAAFLIAIPLYALKITAAGDVKFFSVLALFVGLSGLFNFLIATILSGGVYALIYLLLSGEITIFFQRVYIFFQMKASGVREKFNRHSNEGDCIEYTLESTYFPFGIAITTGAFFAFWLNPPPSLKLLLDLVM